MTRLATLALYACIVVLATIIAIEVVAPRPAAQHSVIPGSDAGRRPGASAPVPDESEPARWNLSRQGPAQRVDRDPLGAPYDAAMRHVFIGPHIGIGTAMVGGWATWYRDGPGYYAAAGPVLRHSLGRNWRGAMVEVRSSGRSVVVELVDWCACGKRGGKPTLLDLSADAFAALAPLPVGVIPVSIEIGRRPRATPPATDTAP